MSVSSISPTPMVTPIGGPGTDAFIALVAVGADYNLLLAMRIREEAQALASGSLTSDRESVRYIR